MRLREVMTTRVETIETREPAENAFARMRAKRIRHLVVVGSGHILGILSERDLGGAGRELHRLNHTAGDLMTPYAVTAKPETTVRQAANLMRGRTIGCLPVVDEGKLVGIVTVTDLLRLLGDGAERPVERSRRWTLKRRAPRPSSTPPT